MERRRTKKETNLLNLVVIQTRDLCMARVSDVGVATRFSGLGVNELVIVTSPNRLYNEVFSFFYYSHLFLIIITNLISKIYHMIFLTIIN